MLFALNLFPQQAELNPQLQVAKALETTKIHSVFGKLRRNDALITVRPFRAPHHTISDAGLVGGGSFAQPGEISLPLRLL